MGVHLVSLSAHSEETLTDIKYHICVWVFTLWKRPVGSCRWMTYVLVLIDKSVHLQDLRGWIRKEQSSAWNQQLGGLKLHVPTLAS